MRVEMRGEQRWRVIATVELATSTMDAAHLVECRPFAIRVEGVRGSPAGRRWFNVLIDAGEGEQRYAAAARAVMRALHRCVGARTIVGFRITDGNQWLTQRHSGADRELEFQ